MSERGRLQGKAALITGAASGIGRASAQLFASEGASVLVVDIDDDGGRQTVADIRAIGGRADFCHGDVSVEADVRKAVDLCVRAFGKIDILYNNAGAVFGLDITDVTMEVWQKEIGVNLTGVYLGMRFAIPHMLRLGGGAILSTSSNAGIVGRPAIPAYGAAKAGVVMLTKAVALKYADRGIRANCLCPGSVRTAAMGFGPKNPAEQERAERALAAIIPMQRVGDAKELACAALFLCSDEASYITGVALPVDGGRTAGIAEPLR